MGDKKRFSRYGCNCPVDCKEVCCVICEYSDGAIEFTPTKPVIFCKHRDIEKHPEYKNNRGEKCKLFSKVKVAKKSVGAGFLARAGKS